MEEAYKILELVLLCNCIGALFVRAYLIFLFATRKCHSCVVTENYIHFNHRKEVYKIDREGYVHTETGGGMMCMCYNNAAYTTLFTKVLGITQTTSGHVKLSFSVYKAAFLFFFKIEGIQGRQFSSDVVDYVSIVLIALAIVNSCGLYTDMWVWFAIPTIIFYFSSGISESFIGDLLVLEKYARLVGSSIAILGLLIAIPIYALKERTPKPDAIPVSRFKNYVTMREKQPMLAHKFFKGKKWVTIVIVGFVLLGFAVDTCLSERVVCVNSKPASVPCFHTETDMEYYYQPIDIQSTINDLKKLDEQYDSLIHFNIPVWYIEAGEPLVKLEMGQAGWKNNLVFLKTSFIEAPFGDFGPMQAKFPTMKLEISNFTDPSPIPIRVSGPDSISYCKDLPGGEKICTIPELVTFWMRRGVREFHTKRFIYAYWSTVAKTCSTCVSMDDFTPWKTATQNSIDSLIKSEALDQKAIAGNTHALTEMMAVVNKLITSQNYLATHTLDFTSDYTGSVFRAREMLESLILQAQDRYSRAHTLLDSIRMDCDTGVAPKFTGSYVYKALKDHIDSSRKLVDGSVRLHLADGKVIIKYRTQPAVCEKETIYRSFFFEVCISQPGDEGFVLIHDLYIEEALNGTSLLITKVEENSADVNDFVYLKTFSHGAVKEEISPNIRTYDVSIERLERYKRTILSGFLVLSDATYAFAASHCLIGAKPPFETMEPGEIRLMNDSIKGVSLTCKDGKSFLFQAKRLVAHNETVLTIPKGILKIESTTTKTQQILVDSPFNITAFNNSQSALEVAAGNSLDLAQSFLEVAKAQNFTTPDYPGFFDGVGKLIQGTVGGALKAVEGITNFASSFLKSTFLGILPYILSGAALVLSIFATLNSCKGRRS